MDDDKSKTEFLNMPSNGDLPDRGPRPPTTQVPRPWRLLLQVGSENKTTIGIQVKDTIHVGRSDVEHAEDGIELDLDLAPYDALANGVSRLHARVTHENGTLYVEDLDSTNGTRINGFQLTTKQRYRLRDGDELEFGRVRVVMRFVRPMR
jgi:pSer/pThr/pTyr-binding forkhead associated (FHA) protein